MIVRAYIENDFELLELPRRDNLSSGLLDWKFLAESGLSWTFEENGKPVACFGGVRIYPMVMYVWVVATDKVRGAKNRFMFFRTIKRYLNEIGEHLKIRRFNAQVDAGVEENLRFMRLLGFKQEYLQKNAGPFAKGDIAGFVYFIDKGV